MAEPYPDPPINIISPKDNITIIMSKIFIRSLTNSFNPIPNNFPPLSMLKIIVNAKLN